jgi:DNA-binding response OmpR family regulator
MEADDVHTLIVDSDAQARQVFEQVLEQAGHAVTTASSGEEALEKLRNSQFELVVSDIRLGGDVDGLQVLKAVRWRWPKAAFVIVAGEPTLSSALTAIDEGVDGYLVKPVTSAEFKEKVDHALAQRKKRLQVEEERRVLQWRGLEIDQARHLVTRDGQPVNLTPTEYRLLSYLLLNLGSVVSLDELVEVMQEDRGGYTEERALRALRWHIHRLRQKLEPDPDNPEILKNVYGVGYVLR